MFKRLLQLVLLMTTPVYAQVTFTYPALSTPNVWTNSNTFNAPVIFNSSVMANCGVLITVAGVLTCGGYMPAHGGANSDITSLSGLTTALSIGQGGTGATTAAGANLSITGVTQTGTLGTSSQVSTFPGTVAASAVVSSSLPVINALAFGAKGDNSTDNLIAFNAWFSAIAATPNSIGLLPPGIYKVSGSATLTSAVNATIQAYGATVIETAPGNTPSNPNVNPHIPLMVISGATNVAIHGGKFVGNDDYTGVSQGAHPSANIEVINSTGGGVFDTIHTNAGYAAILSIASSGQTIQNNTITGEGSPVFFGGGGLIPPLGNYSFGILFLDTSGCFSNPLPTGNSVIGNTITLTGTGINGGDCNDGLLISQNHILRTIGQHAIYVDGLTNGHVSDNIIVDAYVNGIKVNPPVTGISHILIANNSLSTETSGFGIGAAILVGSVNCSLYRISDVTIEGNVVQGPEQGAIYTSCIDGLTINGGRLSNIPGNTASQTGAMTSYTTATDVVNVTLSNFVSPIYAATQTVAITVASGGPACLTSGNYTILASPAPTSTSFSVACTGASGSGSVTGSTVITPIPGGAGIIIVASSDVDIKSVRIDNTNVEAITVTLVDGARADIGPGIIISGANQTIQGDPSQDSAIVVAPAVAGQTVTARVFGNSVSGGNSVYAVQLTGTAAAGTTVAPTPQNDFGSLKISDNRNISAPTPSVNPENYVRQSNTCGVFPWTLSHGGVASSPVCSASAVLDPNGNPSQEINFQLNGGSTGTGADFSTAAQSQNVSTQPNPHVARLGLYYKLASGATGTFYLLDNVSHSGANSVLLTATSSWQFYALSVVATGTGDGYEIETVGGFNTDSTDLLISEVQLSYNSGSYVATTTSVIDLTADIYTSNGVCIGLLCATTFDGFGSQVVTIAPGGTISPTELPIGTVPTTLIKYGDLACAVGSDTTVGVWTPASGANSNSTTLTFTGTSLPHWFKPGQLIQCQGWTPSGYNGNWTVATGAPASSTVLTVTNASNPGASSVTGTCSLVCSNSTDALSATPVTFATTSPNITLSAGITSSTKWQYDLFATSLGATVRMNGYYGSTNVWASPAAFAPAAATAGASGEVTMNGVADSSTILTTTASAAGYFSSVASAWANGLSQPVAVTSGNQFKLSAYFAATGCCTGAFAYVSGGTPSGTGNVSLSGFNSACSGTTATMAITSDTPGMVTFTNPGNSCTALPTTATCTSGTATCSGTMTFSGGVLRGGTGNALLMLNSKNTQ